MTDHANLVTIRALTNRNTEILEPEMHFQHDNLNEPRALAPTYGRPPCVFAIAQDRFVSGSMVTG